MNIILYLNKNPIIITYKFTLKLWNQNKRHTLKWNPALTERMLVQTNVVYTPVVRTNYDVFGKQS